MHIGIFGTGNIGATLGTLWAAHGHDIFFASRDPNSDKLQALLSDLGPQARAGSYAAAAVFADTLLLATPWAAVEPVLSAAGDLRGKTLIDATNPIAPGLQLALGHTTSGAEHIAALAPGAHVVKAFNTTGWENLRDPHFGDTPADMFICGNDAAAKATVRQLTEALGFRVVDAGPLDSARLLEPLALLWIRLALREGYGRRASFKLLTDP